MNAYISIGEHDPRSRFLIMAVCKVRRTLADFLSWNCRFFFVKSGLEFVGPSACRTLADFLSANEKSSVVQCGEFNDSHDVS